MKTYTYDYKNLGSSCFDILKDFPNGTNGEIIVKRTGRTNAVEHLVYQCKMLEKANPEILINLDSSELNVINMKLSLLDKIQRKNEGIELSNLKSFAFPHNVVVIESYTFVNCPKLEKIIFPPECTSIGKYAFVNCPCLNLEIPDFVLKLETNFAEGCKSVKILGNRYRIENHCLIFNMTSTMVGTIDCPKDKVIIPDGVERIESNSVIEKNTKAVFIPKSVKEIKTGAFSSDISEVYFDTPNQIDIHHDAFSKDIYIPKGVKVIPENYNIFEADDYEYWNGNRELKSWTNQDEKARSHFTGVSRHNALLYLNNKGSKKCQNQITSFENDYPEIRLDYLRFTSRHVKQELLLEMKKQAERAKKKKYHTST